MALRALEEPNNPPSGTMQAHTGHPFSASAETGPETAALFFRVGDSLQILADALCVHHPLEGRICLTHGKFVPNLVLLGHAVFVIDLRICDGVEHPIHGYDILFYRSKPDAARIC